MPAELFRQEALDFWTRQRGPGTVLRVGSPWVRWLYWIVLGLALVGLALAFSARIDETASGPAQVNGRQRTFLAVLPAPAHSELQAHSSLRIEVETTAGRRAIAAQARRIEAADDHDLREAGFVGFPQPAILVTGSLAPDASDLAGSTASPPRGRALVVLRSERAITVLLRGFGEGGNT